MNQTKTGKKKLFRMTSKRTIMVDNIMRTLERKYESLEPNGFRRMLLEDNTKLTEAVREEKLQAIDKELQILYLYHDVLEIVASHDTEWKLSNFLKVPREWKNEWDIPLPIFNDSIDGVKDILIWFKDRGREQDKEKWEKKLAFLVELKQFRNEEAV